MAPFGGPLCGPKSKHFGFVGLWFGGNANVQDVAALRLKHRCACCAILLFERWLVNKKSITSKNPSCICYVKGHRHSWE